MSCDLVVILSGLLLLFIGRILKIPAFGKVEELVGSSQEKWALGFTLLFFFVITGSNVEANKVDVLGSGGDWK